MPFAVLSLGYQISSITKSAISVGRSSCGGSVITVGVGISSGVEVGTNVDAGICVPVKISCFLGFSWQDASNKPQPQVLM
jgi:hypothetical protein